MLIREVVKSFAFVVFAYVRGVSFVAWSSMRPREARRWEDRDALLGYVAPGSTIIHDREKSHRALVRDAGWADESHGADSREPAYLEGMEMIDSVKRGQK